MDTRDCTSLIRRHLLTKSSQYVFSTREFLSYGSRAAVDKALLSLTASEHLVKVANGIFTRSGTKLPTPLEVAQAKSRAFGSVLTTFDVFVEHNGKLRLVEQSGNEVTFLTSGSSSSFRYGDITIHLKRVSWRMLALGESPVGRAIRTMWLVGKKEITQEHIWLATQYLNRVERWQLHNSAACMPDWLSKYFPKGVNQDSMILKEKINWENATSAPHI